MPSAQNSQTQMMGLFMPFLVAFISFSFPSGVQLYWVVSSSVAIVQQVYIVKVKV
jgi:YidC/Oxa1 family membrane protein insertase